MSLYQDLKFRILELNTFYRGLLAICHLSCILIVKLLWFQKTYIKHFEVFAPSSFFSMCDNVSIWIYHWHDHPRSQSQKRMRFHSQSVHDVCNCCRRNPFPRVNTWSYTYIGKNIKFTHFTNIAQQSAIFDLNLQSLLHKIMIMTSNWAKLINSKLIA